MGKNTNKVPSISIIVPVYNVEKYLKKCIDSILNQSFQNFELILVDDGSTDSSGEICDEYALKDRRVLVIHKENGGLSSARNEGIKASSAEYVGFVDSDDYISFSMYEFLYNNLIENNADISICGLYNCYENNVYPQYSKKEFYLLNNEQALKMALEGKVFSVHAVNKLYRKSLFEDVLFPINKLSEDAFTIPKLLLKSRRVVVNTVPLYFYVHRSGTITTSSYKKKDLDVIEAYFQNLKLVEEKCPKLKKEAEFRLLWAFMCVLDKMIMTDDFSDFEKYKKILKTLKKNKTKILLNSCFSLHRKIGMVCLYLNDKLYKALIRYNHKRNMSLVN